MPRHVPRSYWARSNAVPSMPKFDRLVLIGLLVVGGLVTFSNDGHSGNSSASVKVSKLPLRGTSLPGEQNCAGDIAVSGGCVRIAMTAFGPKTKDIYLFDDEQTQPVDLAPRVAATPASRR